MNIEHLETFVRLCSVRSFGAVAEEIGISQPAVTYRINSLESYLGARLIEEPRRGVTLTRQGKEVLRFALSFSPDFHALRESLAGDERSHEPLRIVAPGSIGRTILFPTLCGAAFEGVPLVLLFRSAGEVFDLVASGECDVGLSYRSRVTHLLDIEDTCREEFVLIFPPSGPTPASIDPGALSELAYITYEECEYVFGSWFDAVLGERPAPVRSAHHFARLDEVIRMVSLGRGASIVPRPAVRQALARGEVRLLETQGRCVNQNYLVTRTGWRRSPAFVALESALHSVKPD